MTPQEPFTFQTYKGLDPAFINHHRDNYKDSAWAWALHVRVPESYGTGADAPKHFFEHLMVVTEKAHTWLSDDDERMIPAALGGDSFTEWVEPWQEGHSRALHLYFAAPDEHAAVIVACGFLYVTGLTTADVALSTGGDWAEQPTLPTRPEESA